MRTVNKIIGMAALAAAIQGCGGDNGPKLEVVNPTAATALFNPAPAEGSAADFLPFPTDLAFAGSTDGSINATTGGNPALEALNSMDGFSTVASMVIRFNAPVDGDSLSTGLRILSTDVKNPGPHFTSPLPIPAVDGELMWGIDFVAGVSGNNVLVTLLKPLESNTTYLVLVEDSVTVDDGVKGTATGNPVTRDSVYTAVQGFAVSDTPIALNVDENGPCNVLSSATFFNCVPNAALAAVHGGDLATAVQLETLRQITRNHLDAVATNDTASVADVAANVVLSHSVSTQNVDAALSNAFNSSATPTLLVADTGLDSPGAAANVYAGSLSGLTQYLDPALPNSGTWKGAQGACPAATENLVMCNGYIPVPEASTLTIPVMVTAPTQAVVTGLCGAFTSLPVVIFQHGITSNRASLMAFADRLASQCIVGVAIDLPKHGITSDATLGGNPIGGLSASGLERLVDTDADAVGCAETSSGIPYADETGFHCKSGDNFINLTNLANSRDILRQGAVDINSLFKALEAGDLTGAMLGLDKDPDSANIHFVGMSLGGIVGTSFVAHQGNLQTATFNVSGGGVAKVLDGSASFEPAITAGLYAATKDTPAPIVKPGGGYEGFLILAQTLIDSADPINYASSISGSLPVLVQEVSGDPSVLLECILDGEGCSDQVVPNNVFGSSFGPAWGVVSGTGQTSFLAGQNFVTTPVALGGTDPFAQGTSFVALAANVDEATAALLGPVGAPTLGFPFTQAFMGLNAVELGASDTATSPTGSSIVRFVAGSHSSLLDPSVPEVNELMQLQVAEFIRSGGASVVADPDAGTLDQVVRLD